MLVPNGSIQLTIAEWDALRAALQDARWLLERAEQLAAKDAPGLAADIAAWRIPSNVEAQRK